MVSRMVWRYFPVQLIGLNKLLWQRTLVNWHWVSTANKVVIFCQFVNKGLNCKAIVSHLTRSQIHSLNIKDKSRIFTQLQDNSSKFDIFFFVEELVLLLLIASWRSIEIYFREKVSSKHRLCWMRFIWFSRRENWSHDSIDIGRRWVLLFERNTKEPYDVVSEAALNRIVLG